MISKTQKLLKILLFLTIINSFIFLVFNFYYLYKNKKNYNKVAGIKVNNTINMPIIPLDNNFFVNDNFQKAINKAKNQKNKDNVKLIITPHHLLASEFSASLISLASEKIKRVIIIGPNHNNIGTDNISTVLAKWETPFGYLLPEEFLVNKFLKEFNLNSNLIAFKNEHSIGAIVPFVKYYIPDSKILPIIISSNSGLKESEKLSDWIIKNNDENTLIIFSIDFSHYLTYMDANNNDKITQKYILNNDINKIFKLNNDYLDSPVSLATSLLLSKKLNLKNEILYHGNSLDFLETKPAQTTSYFGIIFE